MVSRLTRTSWPFIAIAGVAAAAIEGQMTMWKDDAAVLVGGSCEYANAVNGGLASPAATSPYIGRRAYCAADAALYAGGATCGQCFRVSYDGSGGTDSGRAGSLVVQIVDSGSAKTFDCELEAFRAITGASTGVFPITYEPVECETAASGAVATVLDGNNAWFTKVIFSNLPTSVASASLTVGSQTFPLTRAGGATWQASTGGAPGGASGAATLAVRLSDGSAVAYDGCFSSWPVATGSSCSASSGALAASPSLSLPPPASSAASPPRSPMSSAAPSPPGAVDEARTGGARAVPAAPALRGRARLP